MPLISVHSDSEFNKHFSANRSKPIIIDFTASWCGPCKYIAPIFEELAREYNSAVFLKVDVDQCSGTTSQYGVSAMPTFMAFVDGQRKESIQGADEGRLREMVRKYASKVAWSGQGQRLSDGPSSNTANVAHASNNISTAENQVMDFVSNINDQLRGFGIPNFTVQGLLIQPSHLIFTLLAFLFLGPFGLLLGVAVVFFTQSGAGSNQRAASSSSGQQSQSAPPPPRNIPKPFGGSGHRLGGN